jgi:hypothetical protein
MDYTMKSLFSTTLFSLAFISLKVGAVETPFTPFKDGYANTSQYNGTTKTLIVRAGDSKGWVAHTLGDSSAVGLTKARLSVYVKDVIKDGTLRVYFATSLNFLENQTRYENLKGSDSAGSINISANKDIQGMVSVAIAPAIIKKIKEGNFYGFILEGANGLDAELGAIEGAHGALLYLNYAEGLKLDQAMMDSIAYTVATKHADKITGAIGTRGPKGDSGATGPKGDAGVAGAKGDAGVTGPKGDAGLVGPKGDVGVAGAKGDVGVAGVAGPKGDPGVTGSKGDAGIQGPIGVTGPKGDIGPKGDAGDQGREFQILSDRGYRARYEFNSFSGSTLQFTPDSSAFGNGLTLSPSGVDHTPVTPVIPNVPDSALLFYDNAGSGYATAPHDLSLSPYREVSLLARINITSLALDTLTILAKKNQFEIAIIGPTGNRNLKCRFKTILGGDWTWVGQGLVAENVWTNVQASYDGTGIRTFVNGVQTAFIRYTNGPLVIDATSPLYIGAREPGLRGFFGKIDQIKILPIAIGNGETRNIARWQGTSQDGTDNGALTGRTVNFQKWDAATGLRVTWGDNFRVLGNTGSCRWEILINDLPCTNPMAMIFDKYEGGTSSNRHDPATFFGTCFINKTGPVKVSTKIVSPIPGGVAADCWTGWAGQLTSFEVEEVP